MGSPKRYASPGRRQENYGVLDPELNRALARELYVDSTVNVVNPSGRRKSNAKVKPGQMNLFNPKGQSINTSVSYTFKEDDLKERK